MTFMWEGSQSQRNMRVLITGANGTVGTALRDHLKDFNEYEITGVDLHDHPEYETHIADVTDEREMTAAIEGHDAVVHLAMADYLGGSTDRGTSWHEGYSAPIKGISHVLTGAREAGAKVVYASSNHAVGLYEVRHAPEIYYPEFDLTVDHQVPTCPDSRYGVMKVIGEGLGQLAAEAHGVPFYALRIGALRGRPYDHPYGDAKRKVERGVFERGSDAYLQEAARMKCLWLSRRDGAQLVDRCLQDDAVTYDVFYGISDNERSWFDREHARGVLQYFPQDKSEEWDGPPDA